MFKESQTGQEAHFARIGRSLVGQLHSGVTFWPFSTSQQHSLAGNISSRPAIVKGESVSDVEWCIFTPEQAYLCPKD
jgi:hypothetical protein